MVQELILHIGMPKTGSSSIQASLGGYDDGTIRYAGFDNFNHTLAISTIFNRKPEALKQHKILGHSSAEVDDLKAKFTKQFQRDLRSSAQKLIVSGEGIAQLPEYGQQDLLQQLDALSIKPTVVAYVRPPMG